mmetsp:Transcript_67219/g.125656  ORF Transcript_67219/g.125656 Transcript_67219/m.125656 type:complete len:291 (+) Transcript_67219:2294-3166(+)
MGHVQAQQVVEPPFYWVVGRVPNRGMELDLSQTPPAAASSAATSGCRRGRGGGDLPTLFVDFLAPLFPRRPCHGRPLRAGGVVHCLPLPLAQVADELQAQASPRSLIAVHGRGEEDQVRPQQFAHRGQGDRGRFVDDQQLSLAQARRVLWVDVLDGLAVLPEHVYAHHTVFEPRAFVRVGGRQHLVVQVLLVPQNVQPFQHELEHRFQVLGAGRRHENVGVPVRNGARQAQPQGRRLAPPAPRRQGNRGLEPLFAHRVQKRQHRPRLVHRFAHFHQRCRGLRVCQRLDQR